MTRRHAAVGFALLGLTCVALGIWDVSQPVGQGEVSVILHGLGLLIGLFFGAICFCLAAWVAWWHLTWVRRLGLAVFSGGGLLLGGWLVLTFWPEWKDMWDRRQAIQVAYAQMQAVSEATVNTLVTDEPEYPQAVTLGEDLRAAVYRNGFAGLMLADPDYQRARGIWTLYLVVFLDADDPLRDPVVPAEADCDAFTDLFAARFDPAQHQARFEGICRT